MKQKEIEEALSEFCIVVTEEVLDEDKDELQQAFEDLSRDSTMLAKKNKELNNMMETMAKENKELKDIVASMEMNREESISINNDFKAELKGKDKELLKLLGGSRKLSNMLLHPKCPICMLGLGGYYHQREFNKLFTFAKASTSTHKEKILKKVVSKLKNIKVVKKKGSTSKTISSKEASSCHYSGKLRQYMTRCNERYKVSLCMIV